MPKPFPENRSKEDSIPESDDDQDFWDEELIRTLSSKVGKSEKDPEEIRLARIKVCLEEGANVNVQDKNCNTVLHVAVRKGYQRIVEFLLQKGATTDILNHDDDTAISLAENCQQKDIVRILRKSIEQPVCRSSGLRNSKSVEDNQEPSTSQRIDIATQRKPATVRNDSEGISPEKDPTFSASATLRNLWPGIVYQLKHLVFTLHCASQQKDPHFFVATEMIAAEKLNDVVLMYKNDSGRQVGRFVQIKYTSNQNGTISARELLDAGGNFSVLKYFISWRKIKKKKEFRAIEVRNMIVCTNKGLDLDDLKKHQIHCEEVTEPDESFELKSKEKQTGWYKFLTNKEKNDNLYHKLRATSDVCVLAEQLAKCIYRRKPMRLKTDIFQYYHVALVQNVFNPKTREFHQKFIHNEDLSPEVEKFRQIFVSEFRKIAELSEYENIWDAIQKGFSQHGKFSENFGVVLKPTNPKLTNLNDFLRHFVELLKNAAISDYDYVVKIATKKSKTKGAGQRIKVIEDNINKLAGNVLIRDGDKKIKFNSQFLGDAKQLSGDIKKLRDELRSQVEDEYELERFEFEIKDYKTCTERDLLTKDELPDDSVEDAEISQFFEEFTLAVNQPNEDELSGIIRDKIDENGRFNLLNTELLDWSFQTKMLDWFVKKDERGNGKEYFSYKVGEKFFKGMNDAVGSLMTIGVSSVYCERMKEYDVRFKSQMKHVKTFLTEDRSDPGSSQILELVTPKDTLLTALRVYDTLQQIPKYKKMDSFIFTDANDFMLPGIEHTVMATFESLDNPDLLIVDCGTSDTKENSDPLWNRLHKVMVKNKRKKIIIIHQRGADDSYIRFQLGCQSYHQEDDDLSFRHLTNESQEKLLGKPVTKFQGQASEMSFGELLGIRDSCNIREDELEELVHVIDSEMLVELIRKPEIQIGRNLEELGEISDYYIHRTICRHVAIREDILQDQRIPDLLAVSDIDGELLDSKLLRMGKISPIARDFTTNVHIHCSIERGIPGESEQMRETSPIARDPKNFITLNGTQREEQFEALCAENAERNVHWLEKKSGKYIWKKTQGDIIYLVQHRDTTEHDNENDREETVYLSESQLAANDEPVIISDMAGMGKSTLLTYLAWKIKKCNPKMLVLKIDLNWHVDALKGVKETSRYDLGSVNGAVQFLVNELFSRETNSGKWVKIYETIIQKQRNVALIFDGFNEISPTYEGTVILLLQTLAKHGIRKLIIATRPHTKRALESKLNEFSYEIQPLSVDNQKKLLFNLWKAELDFSCASIQETEDRIKVYADAILKKLSDSIKDQGNKFTGIPLQTKLVAEFFAKPSKGKRRNFHSCKEFINSRVWQPKLPDIIDLIYLYEHFVERKFDIYFVKTGCKLESKAAEVRKQSYDKFIHTHERLALNAVFDNDTVEKLLSAWENESDVVKERTGIITQFINGQPQFGHRTYAEYFAAKFLSNLLEKGNLKQSVQEIFVSDVLLKGIHVNIRAFINCLVSGKNDNMFESDSWRSFLNKHRSIHNGTIFHVAAAEGNFHINRLFLNCVGTNLKARQTLIYQRDSFEMTAVHWAVQYGNLDGAKLLVEHTNGEINSQDIWGRTPLHLAVVTFNLDGVEFLLNKGANVDSKMKDGRTPLHLAAHKGKLDVVESLLNKRANVDSQAEYGVTPLHLAAQEGELDVVKSLLNKGANVDSQAENGNTPLHLAAHEGKLDVVESLLNKGANVNFPTKDDVTPLHLAAQEGKLDVVESLLNKGANVNSQAEDGGTPLHLAALAGELDVVESLLNKGANVNSQAKDGRTPLHLAAENGELDVVESLLNKRADVNSQTKNGGTPLRLAAQEGKLDVVESLLNKGAKVNSKTKDGATPLHLAALKGELDVVESLLNKGADVNSQTKDGRTPLHLAALRGKLDVVESLLNKGANVNSQAEDGETPLHLAALAGELDVVESLLNKGADVNFQTKGDVTPLHIAALEGKLDVVESLLDKGANVNSQAKDGRTPLHLAAGNGKLDVVEYLHNKGANVNFQTKDDVTPLHLAALEGKLDVVESLLDKGPNVSFQAKDDVTPLHIAAQDGQLDFVESLLDKGANVSFQAKDDVTPLHIAAQDGQLDFVEFLLNKGANVNFQMANGRTPLHLAVQNGKLDVMESLLNKGANVNSQLANGRTPLHLAAQNGKLDVMESLLNKGANVNSQAKDGRTPLHLAAQYGKLDIVESLLKTGANSNSQAKDGRTPLHLAAENGKLNVVEYLLNKGANVSSQAEDDVTPLHLAAQYGKLDVVESLLNKGANVNSQAEDGGTPLHLAALAGELDVVESLLNKGANVNSQAKDGRTPLHLAAENGELDVVETLLYKGANYNSQAKDGRTPLHLAAENGELDVVETLLYKEANVNSQGKDGRTPLHLAAQNGKLDVIESLLNKGADFNSEAKDGRTPLHLAAENGELDVVETLLYKGANVNSQGKDGRTPLHLAAQNGKLDVIESLLNKEADFNSEAKDGRTPLHLAAENGKLDVVESLLNRGANVTSQMADGRTPLHLAAQNGKLDVIESLLNEGANVNSQAKDDVTPLHLAAQNSKLDIVEFLLNKGANINSQMTAGEAPLYFAILTGNWRVARYLIGHGADYY